MMRRARALALVLVALAAETAGQQLTREQICTAVEARLNAVHSLHVSFRRAAPGHSGHYVHGELSFLGPDLMVLDSGHGWAQSDWREFYARSRTYLRGRLIQVEWPNKLACEDKQLETGEQIERFAVQSWFRASGYWPERAGIPEPRFFGTSIRLLTALRDAAYVVRGERDPACGTQCIVLEKGNTDRIWLDPDHGFALRRRHWLQDGELAMEVEVPELREVGPLFLPASYSVRVLRSAQGKRKATAARIEGTASHYRVNDLRSEELRFTPPPGAFRFDRVHAEKARQILPGGLQFLLDEAELQRRRYAATYPDRGPSSGLLGALVVGFWLACWFVPAWRQRRRQHRCIQQPA